jgi:hypothetical protein
MIMPDYRFAREDDATGALLMLAGYTGGIQGLQYAQNPRTGNAIWALWQAQKPNSGLTRWELLP